MRPLGGGSSVGDGTVLRSSVAWLAGEQVRNLELPVAVISGLAPANDHPALWKYPGGHDVTPDYWISP